MHVLAGRRQLGEANKYKVISWGQFNCMRGFHFDFEMVLFWIFGEQMLLQKAVYTLGVQRVSPQ